MPGRVVDPAGELVTMIDPPVRHHPDPGGQRPHEAEGVHIEYLLERVEVEVIDGAVVPLDAGVEDEAVDVVDPVGDRGESSGDRVVVGHVHRHPARADPLGELGCVAATRDDHVCGVLGQMLGNAQADAGGTADDHDVVSGHVEAHGR